jgi:ribosome biogenesis GTPase
MHSDGRIIRATAGFYTVLTAGGPLECRARGLFRKEGTAPLVGDFVEAQRLENNTGVITAVLPRKNSLTRPPVANIDRLILVLAAALPAPNLQNADRLLAVAAHRGIDAAVVVTKADLQDPEAICRLYRKAGYEVCCVSATAGGAEAIRPLIEGRFCALCGNTGVGKSTLLNALSPSLALETGEISQKLGRGRHTTRTTQMLPVAGGWVADTPGFSSLDTIRAERIKKDELAHCFLEFAPYLDKCRFTGCSHTKELGCAVLAARDEGMIAESRHESYLAMYEEAKALKDWED